MYQVMIDFEVSPPRPLRILGFGSCFSFEEIIMRMQRVHHVVCSPFFHLHIQMLVDMYGYRLFMADQYILVLDCQPGRSHHEPFFPPSLRWANLSFSFRFCGDWSFHSIIYSFGAVQYLTGKLLFTCIQLWMYLKMHKLVWMYLYMHTTMCVSSVWSYWFLVSR